MITKFPKNIRLLEKLTAKFDPEAVSNKLKLLKELSKSQYPLSKTLIQYCHLLLFVSAYPSSHTQLQQCEKELKRISAFLKRKNAWKYVIFRNAGMPYAGNQSCFTIDFAQWLYGSKEFSVSLGRFENTKFDLNEVLKHTLLSLEKSETTAGCDNTQLLDSLLVSEKMKLTFLFNELDKLKHEVSIRDHFYDGLGIYLNIRPLSPDFSLLFNRFRVSKTFFHTDLLKKFDHLSVLNKKLKKEVKLSGKNQQQLIKVIKYSMALTDRETDPATYLDPRSLKYFELDRGLAIAIYGMIPERQLPLESYVGYTLFKNGFPAAYGGGWVFGERSNFGINIFEPFRGGESGYMLCQLLRVYRQVFKVNYFVVEAYQFGLDNPEGIDSGAFWFYHRYGFKPVDREIFDLSQKEYHKIKRNNKYRTSRKTLVRFTECDMALNLAKEIPTGIYDIIGKVKTFIQKVHNGDRIKAVKLAVKAFEKKTGMVGYKWKRDESAVLNEVSLWAAATNESDPDRLKLMVQMIKFKPVNVYRYQKLLLAYFRD